MKKMAEIMEDLGFRPDGSDEVKKAFVMNLIKQARIAEQERTPQNPKETKQQDEKADEFVQYSLFDQKISS